MLKKRYTVQKSFRIDAQLSKDLETLSEILERPQNDLVNIALEKIMLENEKWFVDDFLVSKLDDFFLFEESDEYENDEISINIYVNKEKKKATLEWIMKDLKDCKITKKEYNLNNSGVEEIKKVLRELMIFLNQESKEVNEYLKKRLNYK